MKKYKATIIGFIYTVSCLLLYYTILIPFFITLPLPCLFESIFSGIYYGEPYAKVGSAVMLTLLAVFLLMTLLFFRKFVKQIKTTGAFKTSTLILFLSLQLFVIHPLVFYFNLSNDWSRAHDGQFILTITGTFQISSFAFIIFGIVLDTLKAIFIKRLNP